MACTGDDYQLACPGGIVDRVSTPEEVRSWHRAFELVFSRLLCDLNLFDFWTHVISSPLEKRVKVFLYKYIHESRVDCSSCRRRVDVGESLCPLCLESVVFLLPAQFHFHGFC